MKRFFAVFGILLMGIALVLAVAVLNFAALIFCCEMLSSAWVVFFLVPLISAALTGLLHHRIAPPICRRARLNAVMYWLCCYFPSLVLSGLGLGVVLYLSDINYWGYGLAAIGGAIYTLAMMIWAVAVLVMGAVTAAILYADRHKLSCD